MKQVNPKAGMTIEFTHRELRDLYTIMGQISGGMEGPRGTATDLYVLLQAAGIKKSEILPLQSMKFPTD